MPFLAQNPGNKLATSKTIEGSVQLYCIRTRYPDWPKSTSVKRFKEKLVRSEWASISAYVIEDNVKMIGKYYFFIVHQSTIGWSVVWLSDKPDIHPDSARSAGIPQKVIQELGWIFNNPSP